jgi:AraC family transcriptional regulator of arabinose operon
MPAGGGAAGDLQANPGLPLFWLGAPLHSITGEEFSAFGVSKDDAGVQLMKVPADSAAAKAGLLEMNRWVRQPDLMAGEFALNALERALLWMQREQQSRDLPRMDARIRTMMEKLASEVDRPFDLASSARSAGMSVSRFAHLFREQVGRSPQQFTEDQKMRHAAQLLRLTSQPVGEIARSCGYDNAFYFSSRFRKWADLSPREFRRQNAAG